MWLARQLQRPRSGDHLLLSFRCLQATNFRLFSPSAGGTEAPVQPPAELAHFMVDYLVSSCGLSFSEAQRAYKPLSHLETPDKPEAILCLLRKEGLEGSDIKRVVLKAPKVLAADAKKRLEPKIKVLRGAGFTRPEIVLLISTNPFVFYGRELLQRVEFWRELVGTNQKVLKAMSTDGRLLSHSVSKKILPNLSLLRNLGVPDESIPALVLYRADLIAAKPEKIKTVVEQAKSLGFSGDSTAFVLALAALTSLRGGDLDSKSKFLRGFGWTEAEFMFAIHRFPLLLAYSEKKIQAAMDFLLNEAGCSLSYIARRPALIGLSLERRLRPRCHVLQTVKKKVLGMKNKDFMVAMQKTEDKFIKTYIVPFSDLLPELLEAYCAQSAGSVKTGNGS